MIFFLVEGLDTECCNYSPSLNDETELLLIMFIFYHFEYPVLTDLCYRYCTGGIRCEMASAYIRSKGAGFENVFQVSF